MILRFIITLCLLHFISIYHAERLHREAVLLARLRNLPHRSLGMLFYNAQYQPYRADYVRDYLFYYMQMKREELFLEGSTRPVVEMYASVMARKFPRNQDLININRVFMYNHFKRLRDEAQEETKELLPEPLKPELKIYDDGWIEENND